MGQGPGFSSRSIHRHILSSAGAEFPIQVENGNIRLNTRFLKHLPVTLPPTNQKKVWNPVTFTPNFAFRNPPLKTMKEFRSFEHELPLLLAGPHNKCCIPLHHSPVSVIWLCFLVGKKNQVLFNKTADASNSKKPPSVHIWKDTLLLRECIQSHHFMTNRWGNSGNSVWPYFGGLQNHCRWWSQPWN